MQPSESEMIRLPKITKKIKHVGQSTFADIGKYHGVYVLLVVFLERQLNFNFLTQSEKFVKMFAKYKKYNYVILFQV